MAITYTKINHIDKGKTGLIVRGHAGRAMKSGVDLVCAAVSAIVETAIVGCEKFAKVDLKAHATGNVVFHCDKKTETEAIIDAALIGLGHVKKQYPQCFSESA